MLASGSNKQRQVKVGDMGKGGVKRWLIWGCAVKRGRSANRVGFSGKGSGEGGGQLVGEPK